MSVRAERLQSRCSAIPLACDQPEPRGRELPCAQERMLFSGAGPSAPLWGPGPGRGLEDSRRGSGFVFNIRISTKKKGTGYYFRGVILNNLGKPVGAFGAPLCMKLEQ